MTGSGLYQGHVVHRRLAGPGHGFRYPLYMLLLDLDELPELGRRLRLFGYNRARPVGFRDRDHLGGGAGTIRENLTALFAHEGVPFPTGRVLLLTHARIFGYVFNPVSFFYCFDSGGTLAAVVAEVNNTYGDRHAYVLAGRPGETAWDSKKVLHVSPYFSLAGTYRWELPVPGEHLDVAVDLTQAGEPVLTAGLHLERRPLTDASLLRALITYPFMTLKVIATIHWEALRLRLKGARFRGRPPYDPEAARGETA